MKTEKVVNPWTFVFVADMQPGSPRSYRYNPSLIRNWREARQQIIECRPEILLVGGDLTRDGSIHRYELEEMKADLDSLPFSAHVIPGNMDTGNKHTRLNSLHRGPGQCTDFELNVTSEQLQAFASVYGPLWWSVDHRNVRFSGIPDMVINSGLPEETAFWKWAEQETTRPPLDHHVWITHSPLFIEQPDEPDWRIDDPAHYLDWYFSVNQPGRKRLLDLFKATGTDLVISGHVHCHRVKIVDGVRFEIAPAPAFGQWGKRWPDGDATQGFLRYTVTSQGIESVFVPLRKTHSLKGYGPGGHPAPDQRDYSLAWGVDNLP